MRRPQGYATILDPDKPVVEMDSAQCGHCQAIIFTKAGTASTVYLLPIAPTSPQDLEVLGVYQEEPGAFCRICMRPICLRCYRTSLTAAIPCVTWERQFEAAEKKQRLREAAAR